MEKEKFTPAEKKEIKQSHRSLAKLVERAKEKGALIDYDLMHDQSDFQNGPTGHGDICHSDADPGL